MDTQNSSTGQEREATSGWSRSGQDAAEARWKPADDGEPEQPRFLDRPVGYVTVRWAIVALGLLFGSLGGFAGATLIPDASAPEPFDDFGLEFAFWTPVGGAIGALTTALVVAAYSRKSSRLRRPRDE